MMENTLNKKQIQYNQELNEIETKKSDKEIQFVHPQIQAQWNKVPKNNHIIKISGKISIFKKTASTASWDYMISILLKS